MTPEQVWEEIVARVERIVALRAEEAAADDTDDRVGARHFAHEAERNLGRWIVDHRAELADSVEQIGVRGFA